MGALEVLGRLCPLCMLLELDTHGSDGYEIQVFADDDHDFCCDLARCMAPVSNFWPSATSLH